MKWVKRIAIVLIIAFVGAQWIPLHYNQSALISGDNFTILYKINGEMKNRLTSSCYDCHSNNTNYPWYNNVQPIGWLLEQHINKGKKELNFSEFGAYSKRKKRSKLKAMRNQIANKDMPLPAYTFIHRDSKLTEIERKELVNFLDSLITQTD